MTIFQSLILGLIQGIAEFFPISSTAHLIIVPYFFHWPDPGLSFDVAVHIGTLFAVIFFFYYDWIAIFYLAFFRSSKFKVQNSKLQFKIRNYGNLFNRNLLWFLVFATIPGAMFGFLFETQVETVFRSPLLIAFSLAAMGFILLAADKYSVRQKDLNKISLIDSIWIGLSQALAIIPGVSRSGATITAGLLRGLDRSSAARFSFLLSTPIILGAAIVKLPDLIQTGVNIPEIMAIFSAAVSGYLAIKYLIKLIEKVSYKIFFWYRLGLALLIILFFLMR